VEGASDDPQTNAARARDIRNLLATLLVSRGAPMLSMGSEIGHSQRGNNNAYAQDNAIPGWIGPRPTFRSILSPKKLIEIRRTRAAFSSDSFLTGGPFDASGLRDVEWREAEGELTSPEQWRDGEARLLVVVLASPMEGGTDRVAVLFQSGLRRDDCAASTGSRAYELARPDRCQRSRGSGRMGCFA